MTPEQWLNVAECAHVRWRNWVNAKIANGEALSPCPIHGDWESWQLGLEKSGRVPF